MPHHTKDKGDLGVAKVYADLVSKGHVVLIPMTEHAPFDLVTYDARQSFHRIQVKYRAASTGTVSVQFRSLWADRHGTHIKAMDKTAVDVVAIYCPETDECYYVRPEQFRTGVTLRVTPSSNGQKRGIHQASSFRGFPAAPAAPMQNAESGSNDG